MKISTELAGYIGKIEIIPIEEKRIKIITVRDGGVDIYFSEKSNLLHYLTELLDIK